MLDVNLKMRFIPDNELKKEIRIEIKAAVMAFGQNMSQEIFDFTVNEIFNNINIYHKETNWGSFINLMVQIKAGILDVKTISSKDICKHLWQYKKRCEEVKSLDTEPLGENSIEGMYTCALMQNKAKYKAMGWDKVFELVSTSSSVVNEAKEVCRLNKSMLKIKKV